MYGLSAYEDRVVGRLPRFMKPVVEAALEDRDSAAELRRVLHAPNPRAILAHEIRRATREALVEEGFRPPIGMGELEYLDTGMGRSLKDSIKKVVRKVTSPAKKAHDKVLDKVLPQRAADFLKRSRKKISATHKRLKQKHKKIFLKYGEVVLPIVGLVLAPFTAGLSALAAGLISSGIKMYKQKQAAVAAKKAAKANANAMLAEANRQERELAAQVESFYAQNQQIFLAFGLTPEAWGMLTLDKKLDVIDALSRGELPQGWEFIQVDEAPARPSTSPAPAPSAPAQPQYAAPAYQPSAPSYDPGYAGEAPSEEAAPQPNPIVIMVNGVEVASTANEADAARLAISSSSPGDRVDIIVNGSMTGLKLRTAAGLMDVPPEAEERVRAMSIEEARGLAERAAQNAGGSSGKPSGGFSWWWVLALPAAYFAAKAS